MVQLCMTYLFTKRERSLIFSSLKKSSFFKSMIFLNFQIRWFSNILNLFNILMILNKDYLMISIQRYYLVSFKWVLFDDFHSMLLQNLRNTKTKTMLRKEIFCSWQNFELTGKILFIWNPLLSQGWPTSLSNEQNWL